MTDKKMPTAEKPPADRPKGKLRGNQHVRHRRTHILYPVPKKPHK